WQAMTRWCSPCRPRGWTWWTGASGMLAKLGFRNLLRNPRRTLTIVSTVAFGSASLYLFHGFNVGTMTQYREDTIHSRYGHGQVNTAGYREQIFEKPWQHWIASPEQVKKD